MIFMWPSLAGDVLLLRRGAELSAAAEKEVTMARHYLVSRIDTRKSELENYPGT